MPERDQVLAVAERFGENLRRIRKREDLSQERLAKRTSLHRTEIGLLEKGERVCRIDTLIRLTGAMAVPPGELLDGIDWVPGPRDGRDLRLRVRLDLTRTGERRARQMRHERQVEDAIQVSQAKARQGTQARRLQRHLRRDQSPAKQAQQNPSRTITGPASEGTRTARHTTDPPIPCLGRSFLVGKVCKGRRVHRATATAPSGGRSWHGSAVRTAALRRGREGHDLRSPGEDLGSHPVQSALPPDKEYVRAKTPGPAFFTERTLAAYLAVSDRTIRNWIRRGQLPSYKLGASRRIDPADVEDFLARRRDEAA